MKDEHDSVTRDAFSIEMLTGEAPGAGALKVSKRYALAGHYTAARAPSCFDVTGSRWLGSKTPDVARDSWRTPKWLFNYFEKMAGGFDLDAAADEHNALCPVYFSEENSALDQSWPEAAKVWMNPPYSDPMPFIQKVIEQVEESGCKVYVLLPDDISTGWFRLAWDNAAEAFPILHNGLPKKEGGKSGRVRFVNAITGKEGGSNNKGSWMFIFRRHRAAMKISGVDRTICENVGDTFF